ncbi:hypothetical protein DBR40_09195 [Pedobacter sp. KBW01]|uniref:hypothetical protein n=1 Tax=Pedobacter sp. KBW01 TaxID=2153364 RepID=UPI000F5A65D0|nr:hypothetical protein [Pedobacter sp. KBW01]RQO78115.1 hypothetical protein DBR40_09195 [Pedobacter sp. KBW01]
MDAIYFNNTPAINYGVVFLEDTYKELRKPAKVKEGLTNNWPDQNGTERDVATRVLETRTLTVPIMVEGTSEADFNLKHQAFVDWIVTAGYFDLKVQRTNRIYRLIYSDVSDYKDYYDHCTFNLILFDDYPHLKTPYA